MRFVNAPKILLAEGIEQSGVDYWLECIENPEKIKADFETKAYLNHPLNWFNLAITRFVYRAEIPIEAQHYLCKTILARLFPHPEDVSTWPEMRTVIDKIESEMGDFSLSDRPLPTNDYFLTKFKQRNRGSLETWNQQYMQGHIWTLIAGSIKRLRSYGDIEWRKPYVTALAKLNTPSPPLSIEIPEQNGLLLFTSHSRFGLEHVVHTRHHLKDRLFIVVGKRTKDKTSRNMVPIMMLKTLRAGNVVHTALDHGPGNFNLECPVFGRHVALPDSSAWLAWKANCLCQWSYFVANEDSVGISRQFCNIDLPDSTTLDLEAFTAVFLRQIGESIENAMIDHPFSFGSFTNLKRYLGLS